MISYFMIFILIFSFSKMVNFLLEHNCSLWRLISLSSRYRCPICSNSVSYMSDTWQRLDQQIGSVCSNKMGKTRVYPMVMNGFSNTSGKEVKDQTVDLFGQAAKGSFLKH
ncbi:uncharacterized protein LOC110923454 [Helianthus annuus]|uniref:uncharacterized protein LOC110923454 n=1 Tax=Helianthus annuus TaxID=4232 RepID=UPI000B9080C3|nr:uncharacterized protein LOC110923454 [Helianthus annuus]